MEYVGSKDADDDKRILREENAVNHKIPKEVKRVFDSNKKVYALAGRYTDAMAGKSTPKIETVCPGLLFVEDPRHGEPQINTGDNDYEAYRGVGVFGVRGTGGDVIYDNIKDAPCLPSGITTPFKSDSMEQKRTVLQMLRDMLFTRIYVTIKLSVFTLPPK